MKYKRRTIAMTNDGTVLVAACQDGSMWWKWMYKNEKTKDDLNWHRFEDIPDGEGEANADEVSDQLGKLAAEIWKKSA